MSTLREDASPGTALTTPKRKRREHESLSETQIVNAALGVIRRDGAERLSMRQLASELGVTPMAIYHYFGNKDALFERVADAVLARVPKPPPSGLGWRDEMKACAIHGFRLLSGYPGLSAQIIKRPPTQQTLELARYGIEVLVAAGVEPKSAMLATAICQAFMFGMIGMQAQIERAQRRPRKTTTRPELPNDVDVRALAEFGLDALLEGFDQTLRRVAPRSSRPARLSPTKKPATDSARRPRLRSRL